LTRRRQGAHRSSIGIWYGPKRGSPGSEKGPYSALRPLDEALPGELDLEGWDSDDDRDNRGPETCLSPSAVPERKKRKGMETFSKGSSPLCPPMINLGSPLEGRLTGILAAGGEMAGRGGQARGHQVSESPHPDPPSPNREKVTAGGALTRSSPSSSSRSDFGPFSALRSFDDADPRELAGEGWDSDADWGYGDPEPCCADVDGRAKTTRRRRDNPAPNVSPPRRSKRLLDSRALCHTFGPPSHPQVLRAREAVLTGFSAESHEPLPRWNHNPWQGLNQNPWQGYHGIIILGKDIIILGKDYDKSARQMGAVHLHSTRQCCLRWRRRAQPVYGSANEC